MNENCKWLKIATLVAITLLIGIKWSTAVDGKCKPIKLANGKPKTQNGGRLVRFKCFKGYELVGRRYMGCLKGQWDFERNPSIKYPICVKPGCRVSSAYVNGYFLETYKGAMVSVVCYPGYSLVGPETVYCDGVYWNAVFPECKAKNKHPPLSCDFEGHFWDWDSCGWTPETGTKNGWLQGSKEKVKYFFGFSREEASVSSKKPPYENINSGAYIYLLPSRTSNVTERLFSPVYPPEYSTNSCFTFWYILHGSQAGHLKIFIKEEGDEFYSMVPPFWAIGDQGNKWLPGYIKLYQTKVPFQIVIEGASLPGADSTIAVDDLSIESGSECEKAAEYAFSHQPPSQPTTEIPEERLSCKNRCGGEFKIRNDMEEVCGCERVCLYDQTCCSDYDLYCGVAEGTVVTSVYREGTITETDKGGGYETITSKGFNTSTTVSSTSTVISTSTVRTTSKKPIPVTRQRMNHVNIHKHMDPSLSIQMTKSRLNEMTKDKIYGTGEGSSPQLMTSDSNRSKGRSSPIPAGVVEGMVVVAAVLVVSALALAFIRRRRRKKTEKESMVEDSDVRFLTSDELLDFTLARPADDDI